MQEQFRNALQDSVSVRCSLIDLRQRLHAATVRTKDVIMEALKRPHWPPINKNLGLPTSCLKTKGKMAPQMQIGYRA